MTAGVDGACGTHSEGSVHAAPGMVAPFCVQAAPPDANRRRDVAINGLTTLGKSVDCKWPGPLWLDANDAPPVG